MNGLFIVLPLAGMETAGNEAVSLYSVSENGNLFSLGAILTQLAKAFHLVGGEKMVLYYDQGRFQELYQAAYLSVEKNKRPNVLQLLGNLPRMKAITVLSEQMSPIIVNDVEQTSGILCAYVNCSSHADAIVDSGFLRNPGSMRILVASGKPFSLRLIQAEAEEVFKWFVENRNPQRLLSDAYAKHTKHVKGSKEEPISACSYNHDDAERLLRWAIGQKGRNRLFFKDLQRKRLLVFWNQKESSPVFHTYDVGLDDQKEIQKMWKDLGRRGVEKIDAVAKIYVKDTSN